MSWPETLMKATLNRLSHRITQGIEVATNLAKDAPQLLRKQWELFQEEVLVEVDRLETEEKDISNWSEVSTSQREGRGDEPQQKIDQIRSKIKNLSRRVEDLF